MSTQISASPSRSFAKNWDLRESKKPRKLWAADDLDGIVDCYQTKKDCAFALRNTPGKKPLRVLVVPLTQNCVDAIRYEMSEAFNGSYDGHLHKDDLTAMLRSIGITVSKPL